jgi:predicted anti-sigma-YlaC factor YlaD
MSDQHPDRDSLSAYLEEALSIDARQWIKQHLSGCATCRGKVEQERAFLRRLDGLKSIEPPADFVAGVMARVAQYPAHQRRAPELQWRRVSWWVGSAAATVVLVLAFIGWLLVAGSSAEGAEGTVAVSGGIAWFFDVAKQVYFLGLSNLEGVWSVIMIAFTVLFGIFDFVRNGGLMVQLVLLLVTVALNYAFTRMVLNYQRRQ